MIKHKQSVLARLARLRRRQGKTRTNLIQPQATLLTGLTGGIGEALKLSNLILKQYKLIQDKDRLIEILSSNALYIPSSRAIDLAKSMGRKLSLSTLTKKAVEGGVIRYKQKLSKTGRPYRKDVHLEDFKKYIEKLPKLDTAVLWRKELEDYVSDTENERKAIHNEKEVKHTKSNPKTSGYERLAKKLNFPT